MPRPVLLERDPLLIGHVLDHEHIRPRHPTGPPKGFRRRVNPHRQLGGPFRHGHHFSLLITNKMGARR